MEIIFGLIMVAVILSLPYFATRKWFRGRSQESRHLTGSMHSRYPECGNRAARRGNKPQFKTRFDRSGSAHSNKSAYQFVSGDSRYVK